jgi:hypothetical protein
VTTPTFERPPFDPSLLPAADESERCAAHGERIELDPGGTALWVDELIVVDVALPWPKPVWAKDGFTVVPELVVAAEESGRRVRVLAAVPLDDGISRVVTHQLTGDADFARTEHRVAADRVADLLSLLLIEGLESSSSTVSSHEPVREFLLCTQGSHDMCCGSRGPALKSELEERDADVAIRRVSHTGGHRMAPTGVTLPDGRMWGFVDADEMAGILDHSISPAGVARRSRGWIGAPMGPAQMAERAVFGAVDDWSFDAGPRVTAVGTDGERTVVEVTTSDGIWQVDVEPGRAVPTIACGGPGGLPAKAGAEWVIASVKRPRA